MKFIKIMALCLTFISINAVETLDQQILTLLESQNQLLDEISYTVVQEDFARILLIKKAIKNVSEDIKENKELDIAPITLQTLLLMQKLMIQYRHSKEFFGWGEQPSYLSIHTPLTEDAIKELYSSYQNTLKVYGFKEDPNLTITFDTFIQIEKSIRSLLNFVNDENAKAKLSEILPLIGRTIAIAKVEDGDNICTFLQASKAINAIREVYEVFYQVNNDNLARELILDIQGQTGFYAEYSQLDRLSDEGVTCQ